MGARTATPVGGRAAGSPRSAQAGPGEASEKRQLRQTIL